MHRDDFLEMLKLAGIKLDILTVEKLTVKISIEIQQEIDHQIIDDILKSRKYSNVY